MISRFPLLVLGILAAALSFNASAQVPPQNPADMAKVYGQMLDQGKAPILDAAKKLDTNEGRYALEGMARRATAPGAKAGWQATYEAAILEALAAEPSDYLVKMLRWAGTENSVDGLAKLLTHESLYDNALRALITIDANKPSNEARAAVRASMPKVEGRAHIAHIQALGSMQDDKAVDLLTEAAGGGHMAFALQSLAEIGHPKSEALIMANLDYNKRGTGYTWALNYAKNLARAGNPNQDQTKAAAICRSLYKDRPEAKFGHVQCRALSVLAEIEGAKASGDLLAAFDGPSFYVQAHAAKILADIPGSEISKQIAATFKKAKPESKILLLDLLAARNDRDAMNLVAETLSSEDDALRDAAVAAISSAGGAAAEEALGDAVLAGNPAAGAALARVAKPAAIAGLYGKAKTPAQKIALLDALDASGAKGQMASILIGLKDGDGDVRKKAAVVAKKAAQPADIGPLFDVLSKAEDAERRRILGAIQAAGQREADVEKRVATFDGLAAKADGKARDDVLTLLAASGHPKALARIAGTAGESDHAVRLLAKWNTPDAVPHLLKAASGSNGKPASDGNNAVAIAAVLRLAEKPADLERAATLARSADHKTALQNKLSVAKIKTIKGWTQLSKGHDPKVDWQGDFTDLKMKDGVITYGKKNKNLFSKQEYGDFILDLEFKLTPGANNGIGIRVPNNGQAAYDGLELQVLDNTAEKYNKLKDWQFHGSIYGAAPAKKGYLKPVGEWNHQTVVAIGQHVKIILNGEVILDVYLDKLKPLHDKEIKGLAAKKGHICFAGHGDEVHFRKVRIKSYDVVKPGDLPKKGQGFNEIFNGKNLDGWKGLVGNPKTRAAMPSDQLAAKQAEANKRAAKNWMVKNGLLVFNGRGQNLCTEKHYADFDLVIDWKIEKNGDSGIYLRGTPQVQIWDTENAAQKKHGNEKGSGGLWNNKNNPRDPVEKADKPVGEWNRFYIRMINDRVNLWLNGKHVVKDTILENYWERDKPVYRMESIELQNHGNTLYFDNIWLRELPR